MWSRTLAGLLSLASITIAQTPSGFTPQVSQKLGITYGNNDISPPGELIPRPEVARPPTISSSVFSTTGKAVLFTIDLDVPSNGSRVTLLHWMSPDITGVTDGKNSTELTIPNPPVGTPYLQPAPPVGDFPHRYVFLLFEQPRNFSIPPEFANINPPTDVSARIGFNLAKFVAASGLSTPIAANYITVQNTTGTATTTFPPAQYSTTVTGSSTTVTVSGGASGTSASASASASSTSNVAASGSGGSGVALALAAAWMLHQI